MPQTFKTISKDENSLAGIVFTTLKKAIFSGQLKPGERLVESNLSSQFGISSIPLREAIKKLEAEKLVEVIPYKGARVVKASPQDIEDMYTIVGVLEGYAAKLATPLINHSQILKLEKLNEELQKEGLKGNVKSWLKTNNQFHRTFTDACQRTNLMNAIYETIGPLGRYWQIMISMPGIMDDGIDDHIRIIEAFKGKDAKLVRRLVENHRVISGQRVKKYLEE